MHRYVLGFADRGRSYPEMDANVLTERTIKLARLLPVVELPRTQLRHLLPDTPVFPSSFHSLSQEIFGYQLSNSTNSARKLLD